MAKCQMIHESKSAATIRRRRRKIPALTEIISYRHKAAHNHESLGSDEEDPDLMYDEPVEGPPVLRLIMSSEHTLFLGLLAFRMINALFIQTSFVPDEYWQSLEVAHNMTFGYGYSTWEWRTGLRGYSYPLLFAMIYKLLALFQLDSRLLLIKLPRMVQGIFAALADLYLYKLSRKLSGQKAAQWTLVCQLTSWFTFYCCTRTLTNSMETALTTVALYYFPWPRRPRKSHWKYVLLVGMAVVVRPTAAIVWLPLCVWHVWMWRHVTFKVIKVFIKCGIFVLTVSSYIDRVFYGRWIFVHYKFLEFNVLSNMSTFYGSHPWHWYLSQGFPIIMGTHIFPFVMAARRNIQTICLGVIGWTIMVYSCLGHKEFRFLFPVLPLAMHVCGTYMAYINGDLPDEIDDDDKEKLSDEEDNISQLQPPQPRRPSTGGMWSCRRFLLVFLVVTNLPLAIYTALLHQRGTIDVTKFLSDQTKLVSNQSMSVMSLMPCHSIPHYSYLHKNISLHFLTCEPNLNGESNYLDEAAIFYKNPEEWLQHAYVHQSEISLPTHLVMFSELQPKIGNFTDQFGYVDCAKFFHTHVPEGRVSSHVIVMCSADWTISQMAFQRRASQHKIDRSHVDLGQMKEQSKKGNSRRKKAPPL